jgi:hypothetical protein
MSRADQSNHPQIPPTRLKKRVEGVALNADSALGPVEKVNHSGQSVGWVSEDIPYPRLNNSLVDAQRKFVLVFGELDRAPRLSTEAEHPGMWDR